MAMRAICAALVLSVLIAGACPAQPCGTRFLKENASRLARPRAKPLAVQQQGAPIAVGTQLQFYVAGSSFLVPATCQYLGLHVYVFVEDSQWDTNGGPVARPDVDRLADLFERATAADSTRGLFALETEAFGEPPDVDADPRVYLLVLDIPEPNIVGFFDAAVATYAIPELRRDTIYLELYDLGMGTRRDWSLVRGTLAHEFQHLIHWGHDPDEATWVEEGLSGYAEELAGYGESSPRSVPAFLEHPDIPLAEWPPWRGPADSTSVRAHYGGTYLFVSYLAERYGRDLIRNLVSEPRNGVFGVEAAVNRIGGAEDFAGVWSGWVVANAVSQEPYTYTALRGRRARNYAYSDLPMEEAEGLVGGQWGTLNVLLRRAGDLAIDFAGEANGRFRVWAYAWEGAAGSLQELVLDPQNRGRAEAPDADSVLVIAGRTSLAGGRFLLSARVSAPTAVAAQTNGELPPRLLLGPAYPNPFNGQVLVPFELPSAAEVELEVYDGLGQRMRVLRQGWCQAGHYLGGWDGRDSAGREVGSGVYAVVLRTGATQLAHRVVLLR